MRGVEARAEGTFDGKRTNCYSDEEVHSLAVFKKSCDVVKLNFETCKDSLKECSENGECGSFWKGPTVIIGGMAVSFMVGALVVALLN